MSSASGSLSNTALIDVATSKADAKISQDLIVLTEKMDLLESMLHPSDAAAPKLSVHGDAMKSVIGYLDACGPRMIELVTACTSSHFGVLSETVFGNVLSANDRLQKLLTDVDTRLLTETSASTTVAAAASSTAANTANASSGDLADQFGDLLLGNEDPFSESHASGFKTTGESETDGNSKPAAKPSAEVEKDPFDDFFAERTETNFQ